MEFFREHKKKILIAASLLLIVCAVFTSGRTSSGITGTVFGAITRPFSGIGSAVSGFFSEKLSGGKTNDYLTAENAALKEEITRLKEENRLLSQYAADNEQLTALLDLKQKYSNYETKASRVIGKDSGIYFYSFVLDKGSDEGLTANMPIITSEGLAGKIIECGSNYSKAITLLDARSSVSVSNMRSGDLGILKGDYELMAKGLMRMEYLDYDSDILVGDEIVTSNLSDIFPAGISVGYVSEIIEDEAQMTKTAIVTPYADFKHLDSVLVVTGFEK